MNQLPTIFDLTSDEHHELAFTLADEIVKSHNSYTDVQQPESTNVFEHLAARMARARLYVQTLTEDVAVVAVMNLLGEDKRMRQKTDDNPLGEAALERKIKEVAWLTKGTPVVIDLLYVSGTDWWQSEEVLLAEMERLKDMREELGVNVRLVRADDIPEWSERKRNDKGGEWNLGIHLMANDQLERPYDYVYLTDSDTTFNLASSVGESLMAAVPNSYDVVMGNRKDPASRVQKNPKRDGPGAGWYYYLSRHFNRHFLERGILDTQCPSKMYSKRAAELIDRVATIDTHAVDTDHENAFIAEGVELHFIPVVAVDSEAGSVNKRMPHDGDPTPAYRSHFIKLGELEQIYKYEGKVPQPNIEDSKRVAQIYLNRIAKYDEQKPWMGLAKLLASDLPEYHDRELNDFVPEKISIDEFETALDQILSDK